MAELSVPQLRLEDLDEGSIFFYRLWAMALVDEHPSALAILQPDYVVIGDSWVLYASREALDNSKVKNLFLDTGKPIIAIAPRIPKGTEGVSLEEGVLSGSEYHLRITRAFIQSVVNLPAASINRDRERARWVRISKGKYEIWASKMIRLICVPVSDSKQIEFGYTWDPTASSFYCFHSKTCKREGHLARTGIFKFSEQKREGGGSFWNLDLLSDDKKDAALMRLVPAGAGYKVFLRQLPPLFRDMPELYA
jgi:hypothetical protein